jgi:ZIP family zinc transporter
MNIHALLRTVCGFVMGIVFIILMKRFLDQYDDITEIDMKNGSAQKMILIIVVMTLHSLSEGIGIGVSFGGQSGMKLGQFITFSLAIHNIPEGLAVALVLTSRKVSNIQTLLWCIFTSIPQPLFAVPAYLFVESFMALLPAGLGFAAGAMSYVAVFELLSEAVADTSLSVTGITGVLSFIGMNCVQELVKSAV